MSDYFSVDDVKQFINKLNKSTIIRFNINKSSILNDDSLLNEIAVSSSEHYEQLVELNPEISNSEELFSVAFVDGFSEVTGKCLDSIDSFPENSAFKRSYQISIYTLEVDNPVSGYYVADVSVDPEEGYSDDYIFDILTDRMIEDGVSPSVAYSLDSVNSSIVSYEIPYSVVKRIIHEYESGVFSLDD